MTEAAVVQRVQAIVAAVAGPLRTPPAAAPDTPLWGGGYWLNSVDLLEVMIACEHEFGVRFEVGAELTAQALRTVASLAAVILAKEARGDGHG
jgi:acyl carrier protein